MVSQIAGWVWGEEGEVRQRQTRERGRMRGRVLELFGEVRGGVCNQLRNIATELQPAKQRLSVIGRELRKFRSKSQERWRRRRQPSPSSSEDFQRRSVNCDQEREGEEERRRFEEEEREQEMRRVQMLPTVCWARARVDCTPSPYDRCEIRMVASLDFLSHPVTA